MPPSQTPRQRQTARDLFERRIPGYKSKFLEGTAAAELDTRLAGIVQAAKENPHFDDGWTDTKTKEIELGQLKDLVLKMGSQCKFSSIESWWEKMVPTFKNRETSLPRLQTFQDFIWRSTAFGTKVCDTPPPDTIPIIHFKTETFRLVLEGRLPDAKAHPYSWIDEDLRDRELHDLKSGLVDSARELRVLNVADWWEWYKPAFKTRDKAIEWVLEALTLMITVTNEGEQAYIWNPPPGQADAQKVIENWPPKVEELRAFLKKFLRPCGPKDPEIKGEF